MSGSKAMSQQNAEGGRDDPIYGPISPHVRWRIGSAIPSPSGAAEVRAASVIAEMDEQEIRRFVEMLAVPRPTPAPPCPLCGKGHRLEARCDRSLEATEPLE
jgi:hypothetical protein